MVDLATAMFPRPRSVEVGGDGPPTADTHLRSAAATGLGPEAYRLDITDDGAQLEFGDERGRRYGEQVYRQLVAAAPQRLPQMRIDDRPDFANRCFSLDISRDRVPTRATLERLVGLLAFSRYNQLQLYVEHTFAYREHEAVWRDASPITPDDLVWLADLCRQHAIDLIPCQNTLGHFERWLRHDAYRPRAECPDGAELLPGVPVPPDTLAPTVENARFVLDLVREQLEALPSRWVNICADEPFQLGKCQSSDEVARRGRGPVYVDYVRRVIEELAADGHQVLFYADVIREHPELLEQLPANAVPVGWCYEAPRTPDRFFDIPDGVGPILESLGIDLGGHLGFVRNIGPLTTTGRPFWVAPGTSSWNSLVGRVDNAVANLLDAAEVGLDAGATGYLVTDWGDNGHFQPPSVSDGPIMVGGALSWCLDANRSLDLTELASLLDRFVYHDRSGRLGRVAVELGRVWNGTGLDAFNSSPMFPAIVSSAQLVFGTLDPDRTHAVVDTIERSIDTLAAATPGCADGDLVVHELTTAAGFARQGAWRLLANHGVGDTPAGDGSAGGAPGEAEMRADLERLVREQRHAWLARARPGGLDDSLARLDPVRKATT